LRKTEEERIIYNKASICYVGLAEKVVCEGREQGTGNREQGTGNREQF
jgi:hypothetical protein